MNLATRAWAAVPAKPWLFGYALLYAVTVTLLAKAGMDPTEPLFVLGTLGAGFTFLAWLCTRRLQRPVPPTMRAGAETLALLLYLLLFAFGVLGWGFSALKTALPDPRSHDLAMLATKLLTMVALPALILRTFGHPLRTQLAWNFQARRHGLALAVLAAALLAFQLVFSGSLNDIRDAHASAGMLLLGVPLCFIYLCVDTGLTEEFLFRAVIQTRLAALFRSETAGVVVMALLFGLAHAPGYYLRGADAISGGHPTVLMAAGYTVAMISVFGFMFGMLWARTRSLGLIVMTHAFADLLPNLGGFLRTWLA